MAGKGGYQPPAKPAPSSGSGSLSRRTDGGPAGRQPVRELPNAEYGAAKEFRTAQQGAPMAATPSVDAGGPQGPVNPGAGVVPFSAPSQNPMEPVTAGADAGPGPGSSALGLQSPMQADVNNLKRVLPALELMANSPNASQATRNWVRRIRSLAD